MKCPHCGHALTIEARVKDIEISVKGSVSAEKVVERYYRARAQDIRCPNGRRTTLKQLAKETGYSYGYLRSVKAAYDKAGKWGSKSSDEGHQTQAEPVQIAPDAFSHPEHAHERGQRH